MKIDKRAALAIVIASALALGFMNLVWYLLVPPHNLVQSAILTIGELAEALLVSGLIWWAPKDLQQ